MVMMMVPTMMMVMPPVMVMIPPVMVMMVIAMMVMVMVPVVMMMPESEENLGLLDRLRVDLLEGRDRVWNRLEQFGIRGRVHDTGRCSADTEAHTRCR